MKLITLKEWAQCRDVPYITAARWAKKSLIKDIQKFGRFYAVPTNSPIPETRAGNPNIKTLRKQTLALKAGEISSQKITQ